MINQNITISILIPALNSERTLKICLEWVLKQSFPRERMEILVIDGWSTDKTREIAAANGAVVLDNPKVLPESALFIGLQNSKGKYVMFLWSDEEIIEHDAIRDRINFLETWEVVNIWPVWLLNPPWYSSVSDYINTLGDPFTYFVYWIHGHDYIPSYKRHYQFLYKKPYNLFSLKESDFPPILDGGSHTFNWLRIKSEYPELIKSSSIVPKIWMLGINISKKFGIIDNDFVYHHSSSSILVYQRKIKWRIINNVFYPTDSSTWFMNRKQNNYSLIKKYLFIPYAFSILFPLIDAVSLVFKKRNPFYFLHIWFTLYTGLYILYYMLLKLWGFKSPVLKPYWK